MLFDLLSVPFSGFLLYIIERQLFFSPLPRSRPERIISFLPTLSFCFRWHFFCPAPLFPAFAGEHKEKRAKGKGKLRRSAFFPFIFPLLSFNCFITAESEDTAARHLIRTEKPSDNLFAIF